jgi:hypothetical protein
MAWAESMVCRNRASRANSVTLLQVSFDPATLALWNDTAEIQIETRRDDAAPVHRTVIWIVVDAETAYVRSVRGPAGRWYRELQVNPHGAVHAGGRRVAVEAQPANDAATVARVSSLLRDKYAKRWPTPTASMLREEVLPTTLRLTPATGASGSLDPTARRA